MSTLVEWGSAGWKALNATASANPGWNLPDYDDSAWAEVQLPLGNGGVGSSPCPIQTDFPPNTPWPANTEYLLRRVIYGNDFTVNFTVDNEAWIYWDGVEVGFGSNEDGPIDCPARTDHAPVSGSLGTGNHLLAVRCLDRGVETYFDCRVVLSGGGWKVGSVGMG